MEPRPNTTLKRVRLTMGKTQEQFATLIAVTKDAVINWENGRNGLSPEMARRIEWVTGARAKDLLNNRPPRDKSGRPVTRESCLLCLNTIKKREADFIIHYCVVDFKKLLRAAARPGVYRNEFRLVALEQKFRRWFCRMIHDLDLYDEIFALSTPLDRIALKADLNDAFPERPQTLTPEERAAEREWLIELRAELIKEREKPKPETTC